MVNLTRLTRQLEAVKAAVNTKPVLPAIREEYNPKKYSGLKEEEITALRKKHINVALTQMTFYHKPLTISHGHRQYLVDTSGRRYLDMLASFATVNAGHAHPHIHKAAIEQMSKIGLTSPCIQQSSMVEYTKELMKRLPEHLEVLYYVNSGGEAIDLALFMSRMHTKCMDTFVLRNSYHGSSPTAMDLTSQSVWKYNFHSTPGVHKLRNPDPYRGLFGGRNCRDCVIPSDRSCNCSDGECQAADRYVEEVEDALRFCSPKGNVMGTMICEPVQGSGGTVQFPKGFMKRAFDLVRAKGGVCVADEVQTGFGRTGEQWAFESEGVKPDIVTMAKGIANGYPMAAVATTKEIASVMTGGQHFNTFGGNPVACATAKATLEVYQNEKLFENSKVLGEYLIRKLATLKERHEMIGDVRGKGLMIGLELVKNRETKEPIKADTMLNILNTMRDLGVICWKTGIYGNVIRLSPPLCISEEDVDFTVDCLNIAMSQATETKK